jgi:hypothetical protein
MRDIHECFEPSVLSQEFGTTLGQVWDKYDLEEGYLGNGCDGCDGCDGCRRERLFFSLQNEGGINNV